MINILLSLASLRYRSLTIRVGYRLPLYSRHSFLKPLPSVDGFPLVNFLYLRTLDSLLRPNINPLLCILSSPLA